MGDHHSSAKPDKLTSGVEVKAEPEAVSLKKYNKMGVIGKGGFGKVFFNQGRFGRSNLKRIASSLP